MDSERFSKRFTSDALWSLAGNAASVVAGLATVKIVTKWVPPEAYGRASLILGIVAMLNGLMVGPMMIAHLRIYFDYLKREAGQWYISTFRIIFMIVGTAAAGIYLAFALINSERGEGLFLHHFAAVFVVLFAQPFFSARTNYLEAHRQQRDLAVMNVFQRSGQPLALFVLLAVAFPPIDALILAQGLTTAALLLVIRPPAFMRRSLSAFDQTGLSWRPLLGELADFGWTLPMTFLVMWLLTTSDRYILEHFGTSADVGRYAMNYGFWSMPFIFLNGWLEILTRPLIFEAAAKDDWRRVRRIVSYRIACGMGASLLGVGLLVGLSRIIATGFMSDRYWIGIPFVVTIASAHSLYVMGYSIVPIFLAAKKMNAVFIATACAALANVGINWAVIPTAGVMGAARATLCAYGLWAAILAAAGFVLMRRLTHAQALVPKS